MGLKGDICDERMSPFALLCFPLEQKRWEGCV